MFRLISNSVHKSRLINSRNFKTVTSKPTIQEKELYPFDYDSIPSDYDNEIYQRILNQDDAFGAKKLVDLKELFDNRCHFGHKTGSLNDYMKPYVFGHRQDITIFDLNQTVEHLKKALDFAAHIAFRDGIILFINPSRETAHIVEKAALECGEYSNCRDFHPQSLLKPDSFFKIPVRLPDLYIIFKTTCNNFQQHEALRSAAKLLTPTIAIVDSNCDPRLVTYPVPGNDDTPCSILLYANLFKQAILLGKEKRKELLGEASSKGVLE